MGQKKIHNPPVYKDIYGKFQKDRVRKLGIPGGVPKLWGKNVHFQGKGQSKGMKIFRGS